jgi:hypothetical protein
MGKLEGNRPHVGPSYRLEDNTEMEFEGMIWICLAHDREKWQALVSMVMNLQVP